METVKHKLFLIPIKDGTIDLENIVLEEINTFLADENLIYLNHSITTLAKDVVFSINEGINPKDKNHRNNASYMPFFKVETIQTFCVISLIYKDLKDTKNDVSKLSKKSKQVVKRTVESGKKLPKPDLKFD